jgi:carbonic anhydrase/acetyltransferase-like protein (isoleucine patch superfamily)
MIYTLGERRADIAPDCYVAPSAQLIGSVRLAPGASVWFNAVIRGDTDWIELGDGSNVQDGTVIHTDPGVPVRIGANVTIGHMAFLHGCTVGDGSMIANGAMVLDGARIGRRCLIAAGALVPPGKEIADGSVVMGAPGKVVREVTERDLAMLERAAAAYRARLDVYAAGLRPDPRHACPE